MTIKARRLIIAIKLQMITAILHIILSPSLTNKLIVCKVEFQAIDAIRFFEHRDKIKFLAHVISGC